MFLRDEKFIVFFTIPLAGTKNKRKFDRVGIVKELRARQHFSKPSVLRRNVIQRAEFIQRLRDAEEI